MAGQLFKRYSGGKTLHQLRHSRLTHLGDQNVSAPMLMAISGHKRSLDHENGGPESPVSWSPVTESNRRPSPYHKYGPVHRAHELHR